MNNKSIETWSFNIPNNSLWNNDYFDTKEEAEKAATSYAKEYKLKEIKIGELTKVPLPTFTDSDGILEDLQERYADEAGSEYDTYDLYDNISKEDRKWLEESGQVETEEEKTE